MNIRQSIVRLAGIVAIATVLLMSSGLTAAAQTEVGLRECDLDTCAVVTTDDLTIARAERGLTVYRPTQFPTDRFNPHLIP